MNRICVRVAVAAAVIAFAPPAHAASEDGGADRIFGVLPNYTTVDKNISNGVPAAPVETTRESFRLASLSTFDPLVYPFVGVLTVTGMGPGGQTFGARYATLFADNAVGNFMTTAVVPSLTSEDSRYYRRGEGGLLARLGYAASRSVITRTRSGASAFNISEVAGTAAAAALSNVYYPAADRTLDATLSRWGTQIMWDTVANELKEFWPDIRSRLHRSH